MPSVLIITPDQQLAQRLQTHLDGPDLQHQEIITQEMLSDAFAWPNFNALLVSHGLLTGDGAQLAAIARRTNPGLLVVGLPDDAPAPTGMVDFSARLTDAGLKQLTSLLHPADSDTAYPAIDSLSFNDYHIIKPLGSGGMSTVWLARDPDSMTLQAIKVMNQRRTDSETMLDRFAQEFRLLSPLDSPRIIQAYQQGAADERAWLAIEFFPGGTLEQRISGGMDPHQAVKWLYEIALGLQYLHERKIIHRDLKPSNIMFRDDETLALTDFGAAKVLDVHDLEKTPAGEVFGSPYYISPERARGMPSDYSSDLYSLGVILFEMLTGDKPYSGESSKEIFTQHINAPLPQLPASTTLYQPLIDRLMAKKALNRCNSTDELIYMIDTYWPQD